MGNLLSEYKKPAISAVVFFITLTTLSYAYAAFTALTNVVSGGQLKAVDWNAMVADLNDLNVRAVPTGAVMAFYGTSCPTGWAAADGTANGVKMTDGNPGTLDLRGEFIRGLDTAGVGARWVDPGRTLAGWQKGSFMAMNVWSDVWYTTWLHWYSATSGDTDHDNARLNFGLDAGSTSNYVDAGSNTYLNWASWTYSTLASRGNMKNGEGNKDFGYWSSRPRNVALLYCVKN